MVWSCLAKRNQNYELIDPNVPCYDSPQIAVISRIYPAKGTLTIHDAFRKASRGSPLISCKTVKMFRRSSDEHSIPFRLVDGDPRRIRHFLGQAPETPAILSQSTPSITRPFSGRLDQGKGYCRANPAHGVRPINSSSHPSQ